MTWVILFAISIVVGGLGAALGSLLAILSIEVHLSYHQQGGRS